MDGGVRRVENDVSVDPDVEPVARWNLNRWLDVLDPAENLYTLLGYLAAHGATDDLTGVRHRQDRAAPAL